MHNSDSKNNIICYWYNIKKTSVGIRILVLSIAQFFLLEIIDSFYFRVDNHSSWSLTIIIWRTSRELSPRSWPGKICFFVVNCIFIRRSKWFYAVAYPVLICKAGQVNDFFKLSQVKLIGTNNKKLKVNLFTGQLGEVKIVNTHFLLC